MKLVIAGSRSIDDEGMVKTIIEETLEEKDWNPEEIISGGASGVDSIAEDWAKSQGIEFQKFEPEWGDIDHEDALVRERQDGTKYDAAAGPRRNKKMAEYGDALLAIWNGTSDGTKHMIKVGKQENLEVEVKTIGTLL
jgi:hypothetical protein